MPVPKRKRSRQRRDKRFANKGLAIGQFGLCSNCDAPQLSHQICKDCGFYKGRKVLTTKAERMVKRSAVAQVRQTRQTALDAQAQQGEVGQEA